MELRLASFHTLKGISLAVVLLVGCSSTAEPEPESPPTVDDPNPNGGQPGDGCTTGDDCRTGVCTGGSCQAATNTDGVKNGDESDVDCGGASGPGCGVGGSCASGESCASGVCTDSKCAGGPNPDCGGADETIPRCADGEACGGNEDCVSGRCEGGTCKVACGAGTPSKCDVGRACNTGDDCESKVCDPGDKSCKAPSFDDGVLNGTETDVDCGGPAPGKRCAAGKACKDHDDCESSGCAFDGTCAMGASCTQLAGGQTCGPNDGMNKQSDCCARAKVGAYTIDKYLVTAGRMRAFLARLNGKVRDFAAALPAGKWDQAYTDELPNSMDGTPGDGDNANTQLGPYFGKRSCATDNYNGHTFWTPAEYAAVGDPKQDFSKDVLDAKALNCVPWWLLSALCAFDGGHLIKEAELRAAYTNNGTTTHPWGARGAYVTNDQTDYAVQFYDYWTPNPPPDARTAGEDFLDITYYIAPPGRRPAGYNLTGHADLVGDLLEWVGDSDRQFVWKGSFERHSMEIDQLIQPPLDGDPYSARDPRPGRNNRPWTWPDVVAGATDSGNVNGYYALGGRCAY